MKKIGVLFFIVCSMANCASETVIKEITESEKVEEAVEVAYQFSAGEHIHWSQSVVDNQLIFKVEMAPTWMTYSQYNQNMMGPLPTIFTFEPSENFELEGSVEEEHVKMKFDKEANEELAYFEGKGIFTQKIKVKTGEKFVLKGNVNFMTCNQHGCEPPADHSFAIEITP